MAAVRFRQPAPERQRGQRLKRIPITMRNLSGGSYAAAIFFNPGMTTQQLEDWLGQQKIYLAHFNRLIAEKAALEERLSQISAEIGRVATGSFEGMLSFPWDPSPLVENPQQDSGQSAD